MNPALSKEYLQEVIKRCNATSKAPWISYIEGRDHTSGDSFIMRGPKGTGEDLYLTGATVEDQDFIAHARQDIPLLLAEIDRLRKLLEENNIETYQ